MDPETLADLLTEQELMGLLVRRNHRLHKFKQLHAPGAIVEQAQGLLCEVVQASKLKGIIKWIE